MANDDKKGYKIVLTTSRAEGSIYGYDPFVAFTNTFPHKLFPQRMLDEWFKPMRNKDGSAQFVPYGLRKVESLLMDKFGEDSVITANAADLDHFVGKDTKLICMTTMDPVGLAYVSTTYNSLIGFGGDALNASEFRWLMEQPAMKKPGIKKMLGGAGVWQLNEAKLVEKFGIDFLYHGEAEESLVGAVEKILSGEQKERDIHGVKPKPEQIPLIKRAASYGMVECTRGCGRMCKFCTPTMRKRYSVPLDTILKEVETNVKYGSEMVFIATEDIFLYKCKEKFKPNKEALVELYSKIAAVEGVKYIQVSHGALAPIVFDPSVLEELTPILIEKTRWTPEYKAAYPKKFISVEVGIETGSTRLMNKHMKGKALPFSVDHWPELVQQGVGNMNDHDWWPLCTLITGLPDETEDDLLKTLELVDDLKGSHSFLTPLLFIPIEEAMLSDAKRVSLEHLSELQWEFITRCWRHNIDTWAVDNKLKIHALIFSAYWGISRWKHGKNSFRPVMKLAGLPEDIVGGVFTSRSTGQFSPNFKIPIIGEKEAAIILEDSPEEDK
ncbi:MAG: radical SAM protein [Thermoplasmata archaeon]|nr:radical SAM protein [Thermoplasmata archaeon]